MAGENSKKISVGILITAVIAVIVIVFAGIYIKKAMASTTIYKEIFVEEVDVSGKTIEEATTLVNEKYKDKATAKEVVIETDTKSTRLDLNALEAKYSVETAVSNAYNVGRKGNFFARLKTVLLHTKTKIEIPITFNSLKLTDALGELISDVPDRVVQPTSKIIESKIEVVNGSSGNGVDYDKTVSEIVAVMRGGRTNVVRLQVKKMDPNHITAEDLYVKYASKPVNASYETKDGKLTVIPHHDGIEFDKKDAQRIIDENKDNKAPYYISVELTKPEIQTKDLPVNIFNDKLGAYTSNYNPGEVERTSNVALASSKINGVVVLPGETFSYNAVVGQRTAANGFKVAKIFENGELVDGLGGGICQVSSTLYNAVLYANLEIVSRTNHSLPVVYVPLGQDATVYYGQIEFVFKNNLKDPIKVASQTGGGKLTIAIYGTQRNVNQVVEIQNTVISTTPFSLKTKVDKNLPEGKTQIQQKGKNGAVVDTYRIVKQDGKIVKNEKLSRSKYNPINQITLMSEVKPADAAIAPTPDAIVPTTQPADQTAPPAPPVSTPNAEVESSSAENSNITVHE